MPACEPRYLTPRTPSRPTRGHETVAVARALGQDPMPWQQHWMLVTGELVRDEETGIWIPAYPEAFATVMRQQGKTLWEFAAELQRAILWETYDGKPQAIAYSGQSGSMARQKFRKEHWPLLKSSRLRAAVDRPRFAAEDTGITFANGANLTIWSSSEDAGHSLTIDMVCMDEIWADADDRREQAAVPAMATRRDSQVLLASTGGTDKSTFYLRKQSAGRAAVEAGKTTGMAYVEYAFHPEDDPEDPATWWRAMPALGYTISEKTVRDALERMRGEDGDLSEFCRAWGNVTKRTAGEKLIPAEMWVDAVDEKTVVGDRRVFAVSGSIDRDYASIFAADRNGHAARVDRQAGIGWAEDRLVELAKKYRAMVAIDVGDPAGYLLDRLQDRGVEVKRYTAQTYAHAYGSFFDRLQDRKMKVFPDPDLDAAVDGATRRPLGEAWVWARKAADVDISPLVALTLALDAAAAFIPPPAKVQSLDDF